MSFRYRVGDKRPATVISDSVGTSGADDNPGPVVIGPKSTETPDEQRERLLGPMRCRESANGLHPLDPEGRLPCFTDWRARTDWMETLPDARRSQLEREDLGLDYEDWKLLRRLAKTQSTAAFRITSVNELHTASVALSLGLVHSLSINITIGDESGPEADRFDKFVEAIESGKNLMIATVDVYPPDRLCRLMLALQCQRALTAVTVNARTGDAAQLDALLTSIEPFATPPLALSLVLGRDGRPKPPAYSMQMRDGVMVAGYDEPPQSDFSNALQDEFATLLAWLTQGERRPALHSLEVRVRCNVHLGIATADLQAFAGLNLERLVELRLFLTQVPGTYDVGEALGSIVLRSTLEKLHLAVNLLGRRGLPADGNALFMTPVLSAIAMNKGLREVTFPTKEQGFISLSPAMRRALRKRARRNVDGTKQRALRRAADVGFAMSWKLPVELGRQIADWTTTPAMSPVANLIVNRTAHLKGRDERMELLVKRLEKYHYVAELYSHYGETLKSELLVADVARLERHGLNKALFTKTDLNAVVKKTRSLARAAASRSLLKIDPSQCR